MNNKYALILIHGSKEHWKRYKDFIKELNSNGIEVITGDLATHGDKFEGENHNFRLEDMLDSALELVDEAKDRYPNHKHIIMGHSMGSFIVKYIVYKNLRHFDGVVLSGTNNVGSNLANIGMLTTCISKNKVWRLNENVSYGMLSKASKKKGYGSNWLSTNEDNEKAFKDDPLCGNDFTNGSMNAMMKFIKGNQTKKTLKNFSLKEIPQLLIYGEQDPVANFGKDITSLIKRHKKYGINNHKVISYPDCKHEIAFDNLKDKVTSDIVEFIKEI